MKITTLTGTVITKMFYLSKLRVSTDLTFEMRAWNRWDNVHSNVIGLMSTLADVPSQEQLVSSVPVAFPMGSGNINLKHNVLFRCLILIPLRRVFYNYPSILHENMLICEVVLRDSKRWLISPRALAKNKGLIKKNS